MQKAQLLVEPGGAGLEASGTVIITEIHISQLLLAHNGAGSKHLELRSSLERSTIHSNSIICSTISSSNTASPKVPYSTVTSVLKVSDYGNGKVEISEIPSDAASFPGVHSGNRKQIEIPLPVPTLAVVGYYDIDDKEIGLYVTALGTQVGSKCTASVDRGIEIELNLLLASGSIGIFKSGNKLKGRYRLSAGISPFKTDYNNEFDLFDI